MWVAALENGRLEGLEVDPAMEEVRWGSIYWAKVARIDKAMDAVFVNMDGENIGLLHNAAVRIKGKNGKYIKGGKEAIGKYLEPGQMIAVQAKPDAQSAGMTQSITSEQFFDAMAEIGAELPSVLKTFIGRLSALGVYPEFWRSLIFRWDTPSGKTVNLGYILKSGELWTDVVGWRGSDPSIVQTYIEDLAHRFDGDVLKRETGNGYVVVDGKVPHIEKLTDKLEGWLAAIERFQNRIREDIARE